MKVLEPLSNLEISQSQSLMTQINQSREQDQNILIKLKNEGIIKNANLQLKPNEAFKRSQYYFQNEA